VTVPRRPVMRYQGGKWRLAPWIIEHFPAHRCYVEPFGGAASVLMRKPRSYAEIYNDANGEVVNVFRVLRDPGMATELEHRLRLTPFARDEFRECTTENVEAQADPIERARMTIFRSFAGFGSASANLAYSTGFRANSNRSGTTPAHDWAHYPDEIRGFVERFSGVVVENMPAIHVMRRHDGPETLHYVDPPYVHSTRRSRHRRKIEYGEHEMTDGDHRELAECLHGLRGMVILSGYRSELYDELYADWICIDRTHWADGARRRVESLWMREGMAVQMRMAEGKEAA